MAIAIKVIMAREIALKKMVVDALVLVGNPLSANIFFNTPTELFGTLGLMASVKFTQWIPNRSLNVNVQEKWIFTMYN